MSFSVAERGVRWVCSMRFIKALSYFDGPRLICASVSCVMWLLKSPVMMVGPMGWISLMFKVSVDITVVWLLMSCGLL